MDIEKKRLKILFIAGPNDASPDLAKDMSGIMALHIENGGGAVAILGNENIELGSNLLDENPDIIVTDPPQHRDEQRTELIMAANGGLIPVVLVCGEEERLRVEKSMPDIYFAWICRSHFCHGTTALYEIQQAYENFFESAEYKEREETQRWARAFSVKMVVAG